MFKKDLFKAEVYRQSYETAGWYKKSWYSTTGNEYNWLLKAKRLEKTVENNSFTKDYEFHTDAGADIRESDKLKIGGLYYSVKWVSEYRWITFSRLMCILERN